VHKKKEVYMPKTIMFQSAISENQRYPSKIKTLTGLGAISLPKTESLELILPYRYDVVLETKGKLVSGIVVSHLSIDDWCFTNKYELFLLESTELAGHDERTSLNG
jgi:hypothetical protein